MRTSHLITALLAAASFTALSLAQDARAPEPAALAGPKVAATGPTIIERGFDGLVKPAEPTPEEAALGLLTLTDAERTATRAILTARARIVDDFITNNIPMLTQFGVAEGTGNKFEQLSLGYAALLKLKPLTDMGPLQNQLRAALGEENGAKFEAILKEYWNAFVKDRRKIKKPDGKYPNRLEIMAGAKIENFGREGERAFQQMMNGGDIVYQYLFKGVALRPDQAAKLREMVSDFSRRTKGEATNDQNAQLFFQILPVLDEAQKKQFGANIREISGKKTPPKKAKPEKPADAMTK